MKHEQTHIKRRDYLIKPLAFAALALHWFNPIIWAAYLLMSKDVEMSCDEAVLKAGAGAITHIASGVRFCLPINKPVGNSIIKS